MARTTGPVIELRGLARTYPGPPPVPALRPASLVIEAGDYVAVTGPSGSGKSTLLHLLGLLDAPTGGSYLLDGLDTGALGDRDRSALRGRRIGFVFQAFHLLPYRTALENVLLAELYNVTPRGGRVQAAAAALDAVGLGHRLDAIRQAQAGLVFGQPWGGWGYLGDAEAQRYGFRIQPGAALSQLGIGTGTVPAPAILPQAEQAAQQKCSTVVGNFENTVGNGPLAGIATLTNDIYNDVLEDPAVKHATQAWGACMARNGYSFRQPQTVFRAEIQDMYGGSGHFINAGAQVSAAANRAQIASAVADADCTDSADLAGIYFAVQASYEQQIVNANQQALTDAVQQYRAAYAKELKKLPSLLQTAKANPATSARDRPSASASPTSAAL